MLLFLWRLIFGTKPCEHDWITIDQFEIINFHGNVKGQIYVLKCSHCDVIKQYTVRP